MDPTGAAAEGPTGLSEVETEMLTFEEHWWKYAGAKESAIRERFDMSSTRYYQVLNVLIAKPAAHAAALRDELADNDPAYQTCAEKQRPGERHEHSPAGAEVQGPDAAADAARADAGA